MDGARWRVFVSHTSELQDFPTGMSYVDEVKQAISDAGHVVVEVAGFPAADQAAAQLCADQVRGCEVYVGVLGTRYGSPVRDRPEVSYTELEFATATEEGLEPRPRPRRLRHRRTALPGRPDHLRRTRQPGRGGPDTEPARNLAH